METVTDARTDDTIAAVRSKAVKIEDLFLQTSCDINVAIKAFVRKYEAYYRVTICDYAVEKEPVPEGTYFLNGFLRLRFLYKTADQHVYSSAIIKIPQLAGHRMQADFLSSYRTEKYLYEMVIPSMYQSRPFEKIVPNYYGSTDSGILILENLAQDGYHQKPNGTLLDLWTCHLVLKAVAQFHALSVSQVDERSEVLNSLTNVGRANSLWTKELYPMIVKKLRMYVLPFCAKSIREKFDDCMSNVASTFTLGQMPNENGLNVILHGDLHQCNVLFKDDEERRPIQCKLIDFQCSRVGSPILDVILFLVTSSRCEVLQKNWESLFRTYLDEFQRVVTQLDLKTPVRYTLYDLFDDFEKYKLQFILPLICYVPTFWAGQCRDLGSIDKEKRIDMVLKSEKYISFFRSWIKYLLPKF